MEMKKLWWFGIGFLALTFGNALGAVHMFRGNVPIVTVGVALMLSGYQSMHYGVHKEGLVNISSNHSSERFIHNTFRDRILPLVLLVVAVYCIAQGFVIGAQAAVHSFTLIDMASSGGLIVGGYMMGHIVVHGVPL
jgi:hypothetical protein